MSKSLNECNASNASNVAEVSKLKERIGALEDDIYSLIGYKIDLKRISTINVGLYNRLTVEIIPQSEEDRNILFFAWLLMNLKNK